MDRLPLIAPRPPRLSGMGDALRAIEERGVYSNGGPVVRGFETAMTRQLFGCVGDCLAVGNATLGLMLAIRQAAGPRFGTGAFALMPSFTFAAAAHAAEWAGLTPLLCDVDPGDWSASQAAEEAAFERFGDRIAVVVPYATFGASIDLGRYRRYAEERAVGVVVDAAASLGALDAEGVAFGAGAPFAIVYSMHATKVFATAEGGVIHSGDAGLVEALRRMTNFGFAGGRAAEGPGFNAKLPEVLGLLAAAKLDEIEAVADHRAALDRVYRNRLGGFAVEHGFEFQAETGRRQALQCQSVLLPRAFAGHRAAIIASLAAQGIGAAHYFSPHLAEQPWFRANAVIEAVPVSDDIAARILSLPITDAMTDADVGRVCDALIDACNKTGLGGIRTERRGGHVHSALIVGGGPAGTALLTAATKLDRLVALAREGLAVVERDAVLGRGAIGNYAITSDSTAETFLTAVKDNVHAEVAALEGHLSGQEIALHKGGKVGVPLARTTPFLEATGARLAQIVAENGGVVATRSEVVEARRTRDGHWAATVRNLVTGGERVMRAANLVIATGGHQAREHIAAERVAGAALGDLAGDRLMLGDDFLALGGVDRLRERLSATRAPRIAIVGGSTSALAAAALILKAAPALPLGAGALALYHRRPLRPFYPSAEAARADGFTDFGPGDICPVSGFVYRLAGFRLEARELVLRMLGVGGRVPDPRMALRRIDNEAAIRAEIEAADVVIGALGYRPRAIPLFDVEGDRIALMADTSGRPRLVDQQCRVINAEGRPVPGVYGLGLASGHVPDGKLGGESSFSGKANGLWLWQNDIGLMIVDQLMASAAASGASRAA